MKGLFQCPPWARGFCPFRAYWVISIVQVEVFSEVLQEFNEFFGCIWLFKKL